MHPNVSTLQAPSLRTEYVRSAWQAYDSAAVRVSVDDHMLLLRERGRHTAPGEWLQCNIFLAQACSGCLQQHMPADCRMQAAGLHHETHIHPNSNPHASCHPAPAGDWCAGLEASGPLPGGDALRFPYSIVEIKLQGEEGPAWVRVSHWWPCAVCHTLIGGVRMCVSAVSWVTEKFKTGQVGRFKLQTA